MKVSMALLAAVLCPALASAQSESALKEFFEGRSIIVKLDMPATSEGVDVYPDARRAVDYDRYAARLKSTGTALRAGESIVVTKIKLKDKLIEFHLGGGGDGTFGDDTSGNVYIPPVTKSAREKNLERDVKTEKDAARKREMQDELDDLRRAREREERRNVAAKEAAEDIRKQRIEQQRLRAGSRFNVRYQNGVPPGITPEGLMVALGEYVEFPFATDKSQSAHTRQRSTRAGASGRGVYKGMTWAEAEEMFGKPEKASDRMEGALKVTTAVFSRADQRIQAEFVEGVLIRYSITSR